MQDRKIELGKAAQEAINKGLAKDLGGMVMFIPSQDPEEIVRRRRDYQKLVNSYNADFRESEWRRRVEQQEYTAMRNALYGPFRLTY